MYVAGSEPLCVDGGLAGESEGGSARREVQDLDVVPGDALGKSGADRFHKRFLGGETSGKAFEAVGLGERVGNLVRGEDALQEAVAEAGVGVADTGDFG